MLIRRYSILLFILLSFAFFSCKEVPRNYNSNLLGPDQINLISFDSFVAGLPQTTHSFKTVIQTGASNTLLLGNYLTHPGNTQVASLLIKLDYSSISDSTKSDLVNGQAAVIDSWIILTKTYAFGDTSANQLDFGAYKINTSWTSSGFTADSLDPGYFTYGSTDLSGQKILTDSTNRYSVHLQSSAVQEQITNYANGVNDYGIYLKPNSTGNTVWGFGSFSSSYPPAIAVVVNKAGVYTDTLYFNALLDVSVLSGNIASTTGDFYLQPSLVGQAVISFDLSSLPSNIIINQAKLILTVDNSNTVKGTTYNSSIVSYNIADSAAKIIDSTMYSTTFSQLDTTTYEGDITAYVQKWVTQRNNQGVLITPSDGLDGLDLYAFKSSSASNELQRPRLIILFTKK